MIYLEQKTIYHRGFVVLPDYSNPRQFYYLPPSPRMAQDPETGRKVFKLIKLVGGLNDPIKDEDDAIRTGVAFFDCDLKPTDDELEELKNQVRQQLGILGEIQLAPLLYKEGEVVCYVLGEKDWDAVASGQISNTFVQRLAGVGKPSLYGDNRAAFSARLTPAGATALEASFAGEGVVGLTIVYTLKFDALRPAYTFKVNAKWEQIYHYYKERIGLSLLFISVGKTEIVEELERNNLITYEEVVIEPGASGEIQQLRKQLQEYILEKFFTPVLKSGDPQFLELQFLGYQRVELDQKQRLSLSFDASRTSAVEKTIYPQANLTSLIASGDLPSYVQEINTDLDMFFRQVKVEALLGGCDLGKQKIAWVHPYIIYGDPPGEKVDKTLQKVDDRMQFAAALQENHGFFYRTGYEVEFFAPDDEDDATVYGQELRLNSPEKKLSDRVLAINPMELFTFSSLEFSLVKDFPLSRYPIVEVHLRHEDSAGYKVQKTYILPHGEANNFHFRVRHRPEVEARTQYRLIYHQALGLPLERDWEIVDGTAVVIGDPCPPLFSVRVAIAELPDTLGWAEVILRYIDPAQPGLQQEARFFFTEDDLKDATKRTQLWTVSTEDPNLQRYQYQFTIWYKDGTELVSPGWIEDEARTLLVGRLAKRYRTVTVTPVGPTFQGMGLRDLKVTLTHQEPEVEPQQKELTLDKEDDRETFIYQVHNPVHLGYEYEVRYRWLNGQVRRVQGQSSTGALTLEIPTRLEG